MSHTMLLAHQLSPPMTSASEPFTSVSYPTSEPSFRQTLPQTLSTPARSSRPTLEQSTSTSSKLRLEHIGNGIFFHQLGLTGEKLYMALEQCVGMIPGQVMGLTGLPLPHLVDHCDTRSLPALRSELGRVEEIVNNTKRCSEEEEPEVHWNVSVHGPLLALALHTTEGLDHTTVCVFFIVLPCPGN